MTQQPQHAAPMGANRIGMVATYSEGQCWREADAWKAQNPKDDTACELVQQMPIPTSVAP